MKRPLPLACLLALGLLLSGAGAWARDAAPAGKEACQDAGQTSQTPLQLAEEGLRLYREALKLPAGGREAARRLESALRCYQAAAGRSQEPGRLYHPMGLAYQQLGRHVEAYEAYKRFLAEVPEASRKVGVTKQISDRLGELRLHVGELDIDTVPGLDVRVDERAVGKAPLRGMVAVTPGSHSVTVGNPEVGTTGSTIQVKAGDVVRVDLTGWRPRGTAAQSAAGPEPAPAGTSPAPVSGDGRDLLATSKAGPPARRPVPRWIWVVTGLAGAAVAGVAIGVGVYYGTGVPSPDRVLAFPP